MLIESKMSCNEYDIKKKYYIYIYMNNYINLLRNILKNFDNNEFDSIILENIKYSV